MATKKNKPSWGDVKNNLVNFERAGLLSLLQDLYEPNRDNQTFAHARLSLGGVAPFQRTPYRIV